MQKKTIWRHMWMKMVPYLLKYWNSWNLSNVHNFLILDQWKPLDRAEWGLLKWLQFHLNWLLPCPGPKIVSAGPNFVCQTKIYSDIVPVQNFLRQTKRWFVFTKFSFSAGTKNLGVELNAVQFLVCHKIVGPTQNL